MLLTLLSFALISIPGIITVAVICIKDREDYV